MTAITHLTTAIALSLTVGTNPFITSIASIFPDIDKRLGLPPRKSRNLINSHRGITHHPIFPVLFWIAFFKTGSEVLLSVAVGYSLHLALDSLTPLGIPYTLSYYPRISLKLIKTGSLWEVIVILFFVLLMAVKLTPSFIQGLKW